MGKKKYTEEEWKEIRNHYNMYDTVTISEISKEYGVSLYYLNLNGVKKRPIKKKDKTPRIIKLCEPELIEEIVNTYTNSDFTFEDIKKQYGVNTGFCSTYLKGLKTPNHKSTFTQYTDSQWEEIIKYYVDNDYTQMEVRKKYNISETVTQKKLGGLKHTNPPLPNGSQRGDFTTNGNYTTIHIRPNRSDRIYEWVCNDCSETIKRGPNKVPKYCICKGKYAGNRLTDERKAEIIVEKEMKLRRKVIREKKRELQRQIDVTTQDIRDMKAEQKANYIGTKWNKLTMLEHLDDNRVRCVCECGKESTPKLHSVVNDNTKSCGCLMSTEHLVIRNTTHGMTKTREYQTWRAMRRRCNDPNFLRYEHYGGRGITVCEEWNNSFEAFYEYMGPRPEDMTIDRIDVHGNYEPGNVRWATNKVQNMNKQIHSPK